MQTHTPNTAVIFYHCEESPMKEKRNLAQSTEHIGERPTFLLLASINNQMYMKHGDRGI
jgi:hypothetical protein